VQCDMTKKKQILHAGAYTKENGIAECRSVSSEINLD